MNSCNVRALPFCGPDSYTSATSANGSAVQIMGMAVCHLTIQDLRCKIRCLVADLGSSWDLIVGQPWLLEHRAELSYNRLDAAVHKGSRRIVLRCGSSDGVAALDPSDPSSVAVGSVPVLSAVQMNRLLTEPGHRIFAVHVAAAKVSQSSGASPGAALAAVPHDGVRQVLLDFADRFPDDLPPGLPPDRGVSHTIPLEPGSRPVHRSMYRLSPSEKAEVERTVKDLLAKGFNEPATSLYGSPILFVAKKDGTLRMVMDYRALNRISVRHKYPLPNVLDAFEACQSATVFTSLDLMSGYHQILITDEDRPKTALMTPSGSYQFKVLAFGLTNAPATFQAVMNDVLRGLTNCVVYMDDILIHSATAEEHAGHLYAVLDHLRTHRFFCKLSKCAFLKPELKYLGHVLSRDGLKVDPDKVAVVQGWQVPDSPCSPLLPRNVQLLPPVHPRVCKALHPAIFSVEEGCPLCLVRRLC